MITDRQVNKKLLKDRYNSIIFGKGRGRELYLVGGYIRDSFMGKDSPDRDYIFDGDLRSFVQEIKNILGGTIIEFKRGESIRIGFNDGLTFDFSYLKGSIEKDLSNRDFTINSIAWSPDKGIIDMHNGVNDIKKKIIRSLSKKNLISDPLRMIRAYRFAAEINGKIGINTKNLIKILNNRIKRVSSERITLELFNLLNSRDSAKYLKMALEDGILTSILLFPYKVLEKNIKVIYKFERHYIKGLPFNIKVQLDKIFSQNLTYKGILCLETLLQYRFFLKKEIRNIKMSKNIHKRIELCYKGLKEYRKEKTLGKDELFDIFTQSKEASLDILILENRLNLLKEYKRLGKIWKEGLISSEEIINISKIEKGPRIGEIIKDVKRAQFNGTIKSKRQAIKFIKAYNTLTS